MKCAIWMYSERIMRIFCFRRSRHFSRNSVKRFKSGVSSLTSKYDAIIVGAGHNGLVSAAYLQKAGLNVLVLERRHVIGGAAVTEEIVPGFKFSRASYLLSLLRPQVFNDLRLKEFGLNLYFRDPNYFTPMQDGRYLLLGSDDEKNYKEVAKFSIKDAKILSQYESTLSRLVDAIGPVLDNPPVDFKALVKGSLREKIETLPSLRALFKTVRKLGKDLPLFYDLMTAPATKVLDKWFESGPLKACLAMDSIIGATISPSSAGSAYVLLHHVMGDLEGQKGAWAYVEGGMGSVSQAIADAAASYGATVLTDKPVKSFLFDESSNSVSGVVLEDGSEILADIVLSNATPKVTFLDLLPKGVLPDDVEKDISCFSYDSPVTKINVAVDKLPNFFARPNKATGEPSAHHRCTIHINTYSLEKIEKAYADCLQGKDSENPLIEMCIPSSLDPTLAPPGCHVISLFTQYTPYHLKDGTWTDEKRNAYADKVFDSIEEFAPGFKSSVIGRDILTPPDLEKTFGLTGGNIFHGVMSLDQLYFARPTQSMSNYRTPIKGLYLCGSGTHPATPHSLYGIRTVAIDGNVLLLGGDDDIKGGGVMGASGRNAAGVVLRDHRRK